MNPASIEARIPARLATMAQGVRVRFELLGYWYGNGFRAGVPATLS